ncbi:hypothetical protein [Desulfovibrio intestinalis]|uniref:Uncharacterized protein n=1 Tax=Desulfovibrio intestinalis TaxID=58621 RepID=A0A7W8BZX6_9BACT|nr:hypothetical protein [Desulfovibrio intestinalis]MBB5143021.1 hypothetical protein [Desulfovibrio intestinalis]
MADFAPVIFFHAKHPARPSIPQPFQPVALVLSHQAEKKLTPILMDFTSPRQYLCLLHYKRCFPAQNIVQTAIKQHISWPSFPGYAASHLNKGSVPLSSSKGLAIIRVPDAADIVACLLHDTTDSLVYLLYLYKYSYITLHIKNMSKKVFNLHYTLI